MDIQARLPPALAALHNFIRIHDPDEIVDILPPDNVDIEATGALATELPGRAEREQANHRRDLIARDMWNQYQEELHRRGLM